MPDFCHVVYNLAYVEYMHGLVADLPSEQADSHGILSEVVKSCPDPWQSKARLLRTFETKQMEE